jgi:hypothetical protein
MADWGAAHHRAAAASVTALLPSLPYTADSALKHDITRDAMLLSSPAPLPHLLGVMGRAASKHTISHSQFTTAPDRQQHCVTQALELMIHIGPYKRRLRPTTNKAPPAVSEQCTQTRVISHSKQAYATITYVYTLI